MSKKNRSVSDEDLQNTSGGVILKVTTNDDKELYSVLDDNYDLVGIPVDSLSSAQQLADFHGIQDQQVIDVDAADMEGYIAKAKRMLLLKHKKDD